MNEIVVAKSMAHRTRGPGSAACQQLHPLGPGQDFGASGREYPQVKRRAKNATPIRLRLPARQGYRDRDPYQGWPIVVGELRGSVRRNRAKFGELTLERRRRDDACHERPDDLHAQRTCPARGSVGRERCPDPVTCQDPDRRTRRAPSGSIPHPDRLANSRVFGEGRIPTHKGQKSKRSTKQTKNTENPEKTGTNHTTNPTHMLRATPPLGHKHQLRTIRPQPLKQH